MRCCHYWKEAGASSAPSEIVVFDTETWHGERATVKGGEIQKLRLGVAVAYRLERGKRTRCQNITFREASQFWHFLLSRLSARRPVWCVAHNIAYDLGVVGGWGIIASDRFQAERVAVSGQLFYLKGLLDNLPITFLDSFNYYKSSLAGIGKNLGFPKLEMPDQDAPDAAWETYCKRDVDVTALAIDRLIEFIRSESLGPWQPSIAGLAFSAYRSRFMKHKVLVHSYAEPLRIERESYYGGIVDTPFIGHVPTTPVVELDVCSMYPSVCREPVPIKIKSWTPEPTIQDIKRIARNYMVTADVQIVTKDYPYPVRLKSGTYYPLGTYRTCLAHPELMHAIEHGHVAKVYAASWYDAEPIFREYMEYFTTKKSEYRKLDNDTFATLCKYYANSLYGKTGQLSPTWREWCEDSLQEIERQYGLPLNHLERYYGRPPLLMEFEETCELPDVPDVLEVRDYYGKVEVKIGETESRESCPAIAATVTSYARQLLRSYQGIAGQGHWYYSDTDSIWCDEIGAQRLVDAGCVDDEVLGMLSIKKRHQSLVVYGPKDYETDTFRRLKGVRVNAKPDGMGGWGQLQFPSAFTQIKDSVPDGVFVRHVVKHTKRKLTRCKATTSGWTKPLVFPADTPLR